MAGTAEILRLACARRSGAAAVHYVSTLSVCSTPTDSRIVFEDAPLGPITSLGEGYAQTKWVAEHLVQAAIARGVPCTIFRPGRITGHSVTGFASTEDFMCRFLKGCIQLRQSPDLDWPIDMNPVDRGLLLS